MRLRFLPTILFVLAATGLGVLGSRIVDTERATAESVARSALRAKVREAEARILAEGPSIRMWHSVEADAVAVRTGEFSTPPEPAPFDRLDPAGADPEAAFYLGEGERAEAADGDAGRAEGLYRAAAAEGRHLESRLVAHFRLAALQRRRGNEAAAKEHEAAFLSLIPKDPRRTLEAIVVRARSRPADSDLLEHLLRAFGSEDEWVAAGLLRDADLWTEAAVRARRDELERIGRLRPVVEGILALEPAQNAGWGVHAGRVISWMRDLSGDLLSRLEPSRLEPEYYIVERPLPPLPEGIRVVAGGEPTPSGGDIEESVEAGDDPLRFRILGSVPRAAVEAEARRSGWMLRGALAALLAGGSVAFVLSVRASRREAEAARARAAFVTKVGHDLRTPLAVVRMYAETLAAGKVADPAEAREFASIAAREAERLTGMVGQVLDLSRIAEGEGALARRPLDLAALAAEVAEVHRPLFDAAGMRLEVRSAGPLPVEGDSAALRGAVANLLDNALRHAFRGGEVALEAASRGRMAEVRVLDRGPGIPAGMEERLFERFVRGPDAVGPGAGLGLALVREAAEAHGGRASASNREGGGAAFALALPLREEGA